MVNEVLKISIKAVSNFTLDNYEERMLSIYKNDSIVKNKEKTFNLFIKFSILKVKESRTKNISATLNFYKSALLRLLNLIDKELYLCSDEEIKILLSDKSLTEQNKKHIISFINYHKNVVKGCKYENTYTFTTKYVEKTDKEIYTKEEFLKMYNYVRNIDIHIEKALKDPLYAEIWFYITLHFTNAWRAEDILDFPLSNISDLLSIDIEYLADITLEDGQSVINVVRDIQQFEINKTGALNKFFITRDLVRPIAIMISILEHYNKDSKDKFLLSSLRTKTINKKLLDRFLDSKNNELPAFQSLKTNRSLLTYFYHSASEGEHNSDVANVLGSRLRGHLSNDTLRNYVMSCNNDGLIDDISFNLFKRGHFCWLYNSLIDIVIEGKKGDLNSKEKTKIIQKYQDLYTPNNIELVSKFFLEQQSKLNSVAIEIASIPNDTLENILDNVFKGFMPCKDDTGQCIYSKSCKSPKGNCKTCPYVIPKIYLMYSLKDDLFKAINKLNKTKEHETLERIRTTSILFKLMGLLNQASVEFGKDYVGTFINLNELKQGLNSVNNKLLKA